MTGPILAVYCVLESLAITCPFSKYFQILYILTQIFNYFACFWPFFEKNFVLFLKKLLIYPYFLEYTLADVWKWHGSCHFYLKKDSNIPLDQITHQNFEISKNFSQILGKYLGKSSIFRVNSFTYFLSRILKFKVPYHVWFIADCENTYLRRCQTSEIICVWLIYCRLHEGPPPPPPHLVPYFPVPFYLERFIKTNPWI